jgi:hypothetical protein
MYTFIVFFLKPNKFGENLIAVTQHLSLCRYYITYHQWNSKPEFIVATHKVVNYKDVLDQSNKPTQVAALLLTPNSLLAE